MPPISLRYTPPYKLHLRKGKYYVSVVAPDEIKHFYADGRSRRSTGTNDQRIAHERASQIISQILDDFDAKKTQLDPYIEVLRPYLIKAGMEPREWYQAGRLSVRLQGEETSAFRFTGQTTLDVAGHSIDYSVEEVECWTKLDIADALSAKGFALPRSAYELLSEEEQAKIEAGRPSVSTLFDRMKTDELGVSEQILANYDNIPEKLITVDDGPASVIRFSHLIPLYLESRKDDGILGCVNSS